MQLRVPSFGLPENIPVRQLIKLEHGDRDLFFLFPTKPALPSMFLLTPTTLKTDLIQIYDVYDPSRPNVRLGYAFLCACHVKYEQHALIAYMQSFTQYKLSEIMASSSRFDLKYSLDDFQYLTYNGQCSVVWILPDLSITERFE